MLASTAIAEPVDYSSLTNAPAKPLEPLQPSPLNLRTLPALAPAPVTANDPNDIPPTTPGPALLRPLPGSQPANDYQRVRDMLRRPTLTDHLIQESLFRSQDVARVERVLSQIDPDKDEDSPQVEEPIMFDTPEADAVLSRIQVFPPDNLWNQNILAWPVDPSSAAIIEALGAGTPLTCNYDMGFVLVPPTQERVPVKIVEFPKESDPGPYPIPDNTPIEGWPIYHQGLTLAEHQADKLGQGGDRHAIVLDPSSMMLYEFYHTRRTPRGWQAGQASIFNLRTNRLRPDGWTSADAAGLPIFPAVVRYDELSRGVINHALRVTVRRTRRAYVAPATHYASREKHLYLPRMGERLRLRADFPLSGFSQAAQTILRALKTHGMFVADNGRIFAISIAPDARIPMLQSELKRVKATDFEVVATPPELLQRAAATQSVNKQ